MSAAPRKSPCCRPGAFRRRTARRRARSPGIRRKAAARAMDRIFQSLRGVLGPNPLISISILILTILAILSAFRVSPYIPPALGYSILALVIGSASLYSAVSVVRLWPRVVGGASGDNWQMRLQSKLRIVDGKPTGIDA